jgi:hypothetical protein
MADEQKDFDKEFHAFVAGLKAAKRMKAAKHMPHHPPFPPPPGDWYDGYNHQLPPSRPFPPPKPPCPNCTPKSLEKYGFVPIVGGKYYTGTGKACCPVKVTITKILANEIQYKDAAGTVHSKTYHDFMTSSWRDKSL